MRLTPRVPLLYTLTRPLTFALTSLTLTLTLRPAPLHRMQARRGSKIGGTPTGPSLVPFRLAIISWAPSFPLLFMSTIRLPR